jgi:hypothetical protein
MSYHGISISAPEIYQARRLAFDLHQLDDDKITFERKSFDDPHEQTYSAMVAIESLSYSADLSLTLRNLASSMKPKGTLVVVDDVVAPWAKESTIEDIRNVTARPSLRKNTEWKDIFAGAGLEIKEVRDLGLEMDLPEFFSSIKPSIWGLLGDWRHRTAQVILNEWSKWYGEGATLEQKASFRTVQLVQDLVQKARGSALRQEAYRQADLGYYMYVCTKH